MTTIRVLLQGQRLAIELLGTTSQEIVYLAEIRIAQDGNLKGTGYFTLPQEPATLIGIPKLLLKNVEATENLLEFKTAEEIAGEVKAYRAQEILRMREELRRRLRRIEVVISESGGAFFGARTIAASGSAKLSAHLVLDLPVLLPDDAETSDRPILTAVAEAKVKGTVAGSTGGFQAHFEVILNKDAIAKLKPDFCVLDGAELPQLKFRLPEIDFDSLSFDNLSFNGLEDLLGLDLKLPALDGGLPPVRIEWDNQPPQFSFAITNHTLTVSTTNPGNGKLFVGTHASPLLRLAGIKLTLAEGNDPKIEGTISPDIAGGSKEIPIPDKTLPASPSMPFKISLRKAKIVLQTGQAVYDLGNPQAGNVLDITMTLNIGALTIQAVEDPALVLSLGADYQVRTAFGKGVWKKSARLTRIEVVEPYPLELIGAAVATAAQGARDIVRFLAAIDLSVNPPGLMPVLNRIAELLRASIQWLARRVGEAGKLLAGLAQTVAELLSKVLSFIHEMGKQALDHVVIEVRLDARDFKLRQIMLTPVSAQTPDGEGIKNKEMFGFSLTIPAGWAPGLLLDFTGSGRAALILTSSSQTKELQLGTDLWLRRNYGRAETIREQDPKKGERPPSRLIELLMKKNSKVAIALATIEEGRARFFRKVENVEVDQIVELGPKGNRIIAFITGDPIFSEPKFGEDASADIQLRVEFAKDAKDRILPFFRSDKGIVPEGDGNSFLDSLAEYVTISDIPAPLPAKDRQLELPLSIILNIGGMKLKANPKLSIDLATLEVSLESGEKIIVRGSDDSHKLLGMDARIVPKSRPAPKEDFDQFVLDFSKDDVRLSLHKDARIDLSYGLVASAGRGLLFNVSEFAVTSGGLDIKAKVDDSEPVRLAGLEVPFRFTSGSLTIERGRLQSFSIHGNGALPPALVGDAKARIAIAIGRGREGEMIVTSGKAELNKSGDPLICHATRFTIRLDGLGLEFVDFGNDGGYQFYFTLTGTARFTPKGNEFALGILKYLPNVDIELMKAPLTGDGRKLLRAISFQIPVEPPQRTNLFEIFGFELRGIGFHPQAPEFGDKPAVFLSGQASFTPDADIVSARFDFHKLGIAPPKPGQSLPQVHFDGLTLGLSLGGTASVEGTAIAVDGSLPTMFRPNILPADVTARGFLASGKLSVKGWASMSASMGFLELQRGKSKDIRHAFFLYGQDNDLSERIPTPIGTLFLREVGYGFGFRYTIDAFSRADTVSDVKALVKVLDDASRYQGELASVRAWSPEPEGDRLTLAMRALITLASGSTSGEFNDKAEKELPNPVLFDVTAALRSDLTFFLGARAWLAVNYADWRASMSPDSWRSNPGLKGYIYYSVPRQEFLGRLVAEPTGHVGEHPKLPEPLLKAIRGVRWSSTLYIRPGLFHQELGWPYELGFELGDREGDFHVACSGGMVLRFEDASVLYGIAFRAKGFARIGGTAGSRSFGASAIARADFTLDTKLIAYVSLARFSESLFYGYVAFDVTVKFEICVWLSFEVFRKRIRLEAGFSISLSISIALELALSPKALGGRGSASIQVGAFGRSIRIGVSFGFHEDMLTLARSRVERFLSLGLAAAIPNPAEGLSSPTIEQPRGNAWEAADKKITEGAAKRDALKMPLPDQPQVQAHGKTLREMEGADFWAILFPVPVDESFFAIVLLPKDHTISLPEDDDRIRKAQERIKAKATFFAPPRLTRKTMEAPPDTPVTHRLVQVPTDVSLLRFDESGSEIEPTYNSPINITSNWSGTIFESEGQKLTLGRYMDECYVIGPGKSDDEYELAEPLGSMIELKAERLPSDPEASAKVLTDAARDQLSLDVEHAAAAVIAERRSAMIVEIAESASRLAKSATKNEHGKWKIAKRAPVGFDARDLGLFFLISEDDLKNLMEGNVASGPPALRFRVESLLKDSKANTEPWSSGRVELFNQHERMFRKNTPRLDSPTTRITPHGIALDWDLEPACGTADSVWNDPEFHLKHYRIERVVTSSNDVLTEYGVLKTTVKAAAPVRISRPEKKENAPVWTTIRPAAQFIDDLSDLPPELREVILGRPTNTDLRSPGGISSAHKAVTQLLYTVVPVDVADTSPRTGLPIHHRIDKFRPPQPQLKRASLSIEYGSFGSPEPSIRLDFIDPAIETEGGRRPDMPKDSRYEIKIRRERVVPAGIYGSDAVTDARKRPGPAEFAASFADDEIFTVLANPSSEWPPRERSNIKPNGLCIKDVKDSEADAIFQIASLKLKDLRKALGIENKDGLNASPVAVRIAVRRQPIPGEDSTWMVADLFVSIGAPPSDEPVPTGAVKLLRMPVEVFEHPVPFTPRLRSFQEKSLEPGRLLRIYPPKSGLLSSLSGTSGENANQELCHLLRDPARRVATCLKWNARPCNPIDKGMDDLETQVGSKMPHRPAFEGGFDIFQLDLQTLPTSFGIRDLQRLAKPIAHVQVTTTQNVALDPPNVADFGKLEAFYPSETRRLSYSGSGAARRTTWFSAADTMPLFPEWRLRRSLCLSPDEALIAELFAHRSPDTLVVSLRNWPIKTTKGVEHDPPRPKLAEGPIPDRLDNINGSDGKEKGSTEFTRKTNDSFSLADVRRLLRGLVCKVDEQGDEYRPEDCAPVEIEVFAKCTQGEEKITVGKIRFPAPLVTACHPVLADVIDLLRYSVADGREPVESRYSFGLATSPEPLHRAAPAYRRYEPVEDTLPKVDAKSITGYFDELPVARDPYGWSVLRTLGLAVGFKMWDTSLGRYEKPEKLRMRIRDAFELALARYSGADAGAPFIDILTRDGGLSRVASFDGSTQTIGSNDITESLERHALATVQIGLRPIASRLRRDKKHIVSYWRFAPEARDGKVVIEPPESGGALLEVIETANGLETAPAVLVVRENDPARQKLAKDRPVVASKEIKLSSKANVVMLRTISLTGKIDPPTVRAVLQAGTTEGGDLKRAKDDQPKEIDLPRCFWSENEKEAFYSDPFGRFENLTPAQLDALIGESEDARTDEYDKYLEYPAVEAYRRFKRLALRRFPSDWPSKDGRQSFLARLIPWWQRFMDHGPGERFIDGVPAVLFSLATLERGEPHRVAAAPDGSVEILLLHEDRYDRLRRYFVQPFGRYDHIEEMLKAEDAVSESPKGSNGRKPGRRLLPHICSEEDEQTATQLLKMMAHRKPFVDITVPRSAVLAPPLIISAARCTKDEKQLQLVLARHPEEALIEANRELEGALGFEHVAVGLWREFTAYRWARGMPWGDHTPNFDAGFGDRRLPEGVEKEVMEEPHDLSRSKEPFGDLVKTVPDGWSGISVLGFAGLPFFFRIHAVAWAAAGAIVSKPVVATFEEGYHELNRPWSDDKAWVKTSKPAFTVTLENGDRKAPMKVSFLIPLVRFGDEMDEISRKIWIPAGRDVHQIFTVPDPAVRYEIHLAVTGTNISGERVQRSTEREVELVAAVDPKENKNGSQIIVRTVGTRFNLNEGRVAGISYTPQEDCAREWVAKAELTIKGTEPEPKVPSFAQPDLARSVEPEHKINGHTVLHLFEMAADSFGNSKDSAWAHLAPETEVELVITRPEPPPQNPTGWQTFSADVKAWSDAFKEFAQAAEAAAEIAGMLEDATKLNSIDDWQRFAGGAFQSKKITVKHFKAGLPRLPGGLRKAGILRIRSTGPGLWTWPSLQLPNETLTGIATRFALASAFEAARFAGESNEEKQSNRDYFNSLISRPLLKALRSYEIAHREWKDRAPWGGIAPTVEMLSPDLRLIAKSLKMNQIPESIEFMQPVSLNLADHEYKPQRDAENLKALVKLLVEKPQTAEALTVLGRFEEGFSTTPIELRLPVRYLSDEGEVMEAMKQLAADVTVCPLGPDALVLRRPPTNEERDKVRTSITNLSSEANQLLAAFFEETADNQLFGTGRRPHIFILRGDKDPLHDIIENKRGGE